MKSAGKIPAWNEKIILSVPTINSELLLPTTGIVLRVMDEDVTKHDVVGESVLITLKEIFAYTATARVHPVKLIWQGKEAGILNVEYQFETKAPVEKKILIDGNLSVTVMTAVLTRDLDSFTKMDPKCEMEFVNL